MAITLYEHSGRSVGFLHAHEFVGNDRGGLVPRNALELALAAVLRVALSLWIPIHALKRIGNAVGRVRTLLVCDRERRKQRAMLCLVHLSTRLDLPRVPLLGLVCLIVVERSRADDLTILHVDRRRARRDGEAVEPEAFDMRRIFDLRFFRHRSSLLRRPFLVCAPVPSPLPILDCG